MKAPLFALLLLGAAAPRPALAGEGIEGTTGGVKLGVNGSRWVGADGANVSYGFGLAGFATFPLEALVGAPGLSFQPELFMHEKGSDFASISGEPADEGLLYLEAPLLVRYDVPLADFVNGYGAGGPGVAWVIDSKRTSKDQLNKLDVTVWATAGARFDTGSPHFVDVELRFSYGLLDLLDREANDETARNLVFGLYAGVTL